MIKKVLYLWSEHCAPQRQEIVIGEGPEDRPEIPTSAAVRWKAIVDAAEARRKRIINRWKRKL